MNGRRIMARVARLLAGVTLGSCLLFGCGGVGSGGTGAYLSSSVTGFASVIAGGVEFDDSQAQVLDDDGLPIARNGNELRLGMSVGIDASTLAAGANGPQGTGRTIRIATAALGPVAAVDSAAGTLTVLGQTVQVNAATVFGPSMKGGLSSIRVGDLVAVYGFVAEPGADLAATRVEPVQNPSAYRLRGVVAGLDSGSRTFRIGTATLSYATATGVPATLADGDVVSVKLPTATPAGALDVLAFSPAAQPADGETATIEGLVTSYANAGSFAVDGVPVDARQAVLAPGSSAVALGGFVSVQGLYNGGQLSATTVTVPGPGALAARRFVLAGTLSNLNAAAQTFTVRNVDVDASGAQYVNGTSADLANGVKLQVDGPLSADGTHVVASTITFH